MPSRATLLNFIKERELNPFDKHTYARIVNQHHVTKRYECSMLASRRFAESRSL